MSKPACVVVGIGPGNGAAFVRRFAAGGYAVAMLSRSTTLGEALATELGGPDVARAYACDVSDPAAVQRAFAAVREDLGAPEVVVYNAGSGVWGNVEETRLEDFEAAWRVNTLGAVACAREVIAPMKRAKKGSFVFVGATASRRGGAKTAAFASSKAAQRSLAESMARHLWPSGIHVALIVIDGVVDLPRTRERLRDKPDSFFVEPAGVAEIAWQLVKQSPSAWSFEVEARPFAETW